jgi:hypothetical protein
MAGAIFPNPNVYTNSKKIHAYFESEFVKCNLSHPAWPPSPDAQGSPHQKEPQMSGAIDPPQRVINRGTGIRTAKIYEEGIATYRGTFPSDRS